MMPMLRAEMMEAGDGGRNGQRVDVGSAEELRLTGIPRTRACCRQRERADRGRDCKTANNATAVCLAVLGLHGLPYNHE